MADLGINKSDFQVISEPGFYVFSIFQQKYTFAGAEITDKTGDIWIFAYQENGNDSIVRYKNAPYFYSIQQIRDMAWKQIPRIATGSNPFEGNHVAQSPNGRLWITAYREYVLNTETRLLTTYFDGTSWQTWTRFNNRDLTHYHESGLIIDGTNVVFAYLLDGGEPDELQNKERELYYKSVSQGVAIGDIQAVSDTYVLTLGVNAVIASPILKTSSGNYIFAYQKATTQSLPYTSTLYCRTASTIAGLTTATEVTIASNFPSGGGIGMPSLTEILTTKTIVVIYDKTNNTTIAYKTSTDEGATWSSEQSVSTDFGGDNIILADLNDKLHVGTNNYANGQYTPYLCRVPRISRKVTRGCPLCGTLQWNRLIPDQKNAVGKALHPTPTGGGGLLRNDDPTGSGPTYFHCVSCGWILDVAKTVKGSGMGATGNTLGYD